MSWTSEGKSGHVCIHLQMIQLLFYNGLLGGEEHRLHLSKSHHSST